MTSDEDDRRADLADGAAATAERMQPAIGIVTASLDGNPELKLAAVMAALDRERGTVEFPNRMASLVFGLADLGTVLAAQLANARGVEAREVLQEMGQFAARSDELRELARRLREGLPPEDLT